MNVDQTESGKLCASKKALPGKPVGSMHHDEWKKMYGEKLDILTYDPGFSGTALINNAVIASVQAKLTPSDCLLLAYHCLSNVSMDLSILQCEMSLATLMNFMARCHYLSKVSQHYKYLAGMVRSALGDISSQVHLMKQSLKGKGCHEWRGLLSKSIENMWLYLNEMRVNNLCLNAFHLANHNFARRTVYSCYFLPTKRVENLFDILNKASNNFLSEMEKKCHCKILLHKTKEDKSPPYSGPCAQMEVIFDYFYGNSDSLSSMLHTLTRSILSHEKESLTHFLIHHLSVHRLGQIFYLETADLTFQSGDFNNSSRTCCPQRVYYGKSELKSTPCTSTPTRRCLPSFQFSCSNSTILSRPNSPVTTEHTKSHREESESMAEECQSGSTTKKMDSYDFPDHSPCGLHTLDDAEDSTYQPSGVPLLATPTADHYFMGMTQVSQNFCIYQAPLLPENQPIKTPKLVSVSSYAHIRSLFQNSHALLDCRDKLVLPTRLLTPRSDQMQDLCNHVVLQLCLLTTSQNITFILQNFRKYCEALLTSWYLLPERALQIGKRMRVVNRLEKILNNHVPDHECQTFYKITASKLGCLFESSKIQVSKIIRLKYCGIKIVYSSFFLVPLCRLEEIMKLDMNSNEGDRRIKRIESICHCIIKVTTKPLNDAPMEGILVEILYDLVRGNHFGAIQMISGLLSTSFNISSRHLLHRHYRSIIYYPSGEMEIVDDLKWLQMTVPKKGN